jgi:hypothetical protein
VHSAVALLSMIALLIDERDGRIRHLKPDWLLSLRHKHSNTYIFTPCIARTTCNFQCKIGHNAMQFATVPDARYRRIQPDSGPRSPDTTGYRRIPPDTTGYQHDVRQKSRTSTMSDKSHSNRRIFQLILLSFLHLARAGVCQLASLQIHIFPQTTFFFLFEKNFVCANAMGTM